MPPFQPQAAHFGLILPLCSSSATIGLALYQYPQMLSFLHAEPSVSGKTLSRYWDPMFKQAYVVIGGLGVLSTASGFFSARWLRTHQTLETTDVSRWYTYGTILAALHFAFVPLVRAPVSRMIAAGKDEVKTDSQVEEENRKEMQTWLTWHTVRTIAVDLPALWCFAEGAAQSFWVANV